MATTNNAELAHAMELLRSHGITRDAAHMTHAPDGPWYYQQIALGYNYRMTELQAALGLNQMQRLDAFVSQRHALAKRYDDLLAEMPLQTPWQHPDGYSGLHLYVVQIGPQASGKTRQDVFAELRKHGIGVNVHYIPVHTQPFYTQMGFKVGDFPQSEQYYAQAISLPMFQDLTHEQQDHVVHALTEALTP